MHGPGERDVSRRDAEWPNLPSRITFIAGTLGQGGAERQLYYILRTLREHTVHLRLLCLTSGEFWEKLIREAEISVTWIGQSGSRLVRLLRLVRELREERPDVLQSQHFYTNLYAVAAARILGLKEIGAIRNDVTSEVADTVFGKLCLKGPNTVAANSRAAIGTAIALGVARERCYFLPNVVDTSRFHPAPMRRAGESVRLLAVGRLVRQKRIDRLLHVLAVIRARTKVSFQAEIIGGGSERRALEAQAAALGLLPSIVNFRGTCADLLPEYHRADILVLSSDWEGTPNVILEAMASGLAVVATPVGGVPEIVHDGETGFLAHSPTDEELTKKLVNLIEDPPLRQRIGSQARSFVEQHHSVRRLPHFLEGLYKMVQS